MTDIKETVRRAWTSAIERNEPVTITRLADELIETHADLLTEHAEYLCRAAIVRMLKRLAREQTEDEGLQMSLFGFPSVIAVPLESKEEGNGYYYIRSTHATYAELKAGQLVRTENVQRAQARLDSYNAALAAVRPLLEGTDKTLADIRAEELPAA